MRTGAVRLEARAELVQQRSSLVVSVPGQSAVGQGLGKDDGIPSLHLDVDDVLLVALPAFYGLWAWQVRLMAPGITAAPPSPGPSSARRYSTTDQILLRFMTDLPVASVARSREAASVSLAKEQQIVVQCKQQV